MLKNISICRISGNILKEIEYNDFTDLSNQLQALILSYDADICITLLLNDNILNTFNIFNTEILVKLNDFEHNTITIIFNQKKELYGFKNEKGKYILNFKNDNYSKILQGIIELYKNDSYDIIINSSYKDLMIEALKDDGRVLAFIGIELQKDKELVLEAVKQNGMVLEFCSIEFKNDKEIVLEAVKQNGHSLEFANINLRNNKEIVLEAIERSGYILKYTTILRDDKEIVLKAVKNYGSSLQFVSNNLQKDKEVVLAAIKSDISAFYYVDKNLQNDDELKEVRYKYLELFSKQRIK